MENLDFNRIHRFRYDDLKILLDVNSGSIHVIDQPTWDFFDYLAVNNMETAFSLLMDQYGYAEAEAAKSPRAPCTFRIPARCGLTLKSRRPTTIYCVLPKICQQDIDKH
ncbi:MAG: hypothetical protein IIV02_01565, partial [Peptococcaceae bacterium]|nr:hypothetical protein [Peptococcaceae bacterium]